MDELHRKLDRFLIESPAAPRRIRISTPPVSPAPVISAYKQRVVI
jgi:hypothetical protein